MVTVVPDSLRQQKGGRSMMKAWGVIYPSLPVRLFVCGRGVMGEEGCGGGMKVEVDWTRFEAEMSRLVAVTCLDRGVTFRAYRVGSDLCGGRVW